MRWSRTDRVLGRREAVSLTIGRSVAFPRRDRLFAERGLARARAQAQLLVLGSRHLELPGRVSGRLPRRIQLLG
ncbi:MAG TPA: hypothetical protein VF076_03310, partial [Acidimicrobiales bacterium]